MSDEIDIGAELAPDPTTDFRARARKAAETGAVAPQAKTGESPPTVARETDFPVTIHDPWTGIVRASWRVTSRVFDGPEHAAAVRYAAHLAGVSMDTLSREDREWFRSLARAELQIRSVTGGPLGPDAKPEKRLQDFINRLWSDPELLAMVTRRLGEHEDRFHELKAEPLTPDLVFELHRLVTADTLEKPDAAGRLRRADEQIAVVDHDDQVLHTPPPADTLPRRISALCDFANGRTPKGFVHPALRAIILHFWLAYEHPFVDGNGRTARALFYWSMLRSGYWLFEYASISEVILRAPAKYGRAFLLTETDDNDLTYFVLYHLEVIRESLDTLKRFIAKKADDVRSLDQILRLAADRFNHRQRELLSHALRHPSEVYTIAGHQARQAVVYQTARTDLLSLADAGLLTKSEAGKKLVFRPVRDLEKRLRRLGEES